MGQKVDESIVVFGASALAHYLEALKQEIEGVRLAEDIEYIHRMRVASRRLRTAFSLFAECLPARKGRLWQPAVRSITRSLGEARDTDVQLELLDDFYSHLAEEMYKPGIRRLQLRLQQQRAKMQVKVLSSLDELVTGGVIPAMDAWLQGRLVHQDRVYLYSPALFQLAFKSIVTYLDDFLSYAPFVEQPEKVAELHAMRIASKWLRYTLETFEPLYDGHLKPFIQTMRWVQEALGDIHDSDMWILGLPEFIEKERRLTNRYFGNERQVRRLLPGLNFFHQDRQQFRDRRYQEYVTRWQELQANATWQELRQTIQVPFDLASARRFTLEKQDALPPDPQP